MKMKRSSLFALVFTPLLAFAVQAESLVAGSAEAGKAKSAVCAACHGAEGISSSATPTWPNLAGQNAPYTMQQLKAFKDGTRSDPLMTSQAMMLSDQDMADLAVYFESLPSAAQPVADASLIERGQALYRGGDKEDKSSACIACHGPTGAGNPAAKYPALKGQHSVYTAKQLNDYASGSRTSDGGTRIMRDIAATLDKDDIAALSAYVQGLK